jgi:hypothetical protein
MCVSPSAEMPFSGEITGCAGGDQQKSGVFDVVSLIFPLRELL